jgi:hypothetical protein
LPEFVIFFRHRGISKAHGGFFVWVSSLMPVDAPEPKHLFKLAEHTPTSQRQETEVRLCILLKRNTV